MDLYLIIGVILFGIILVIAEIFIVPGTTIVGIAGGIMMVAGVVMGYTQQDSMLVGHAILAGTSVATVVLGWLAYRALQSSSYSLTDTVSSQVNLLDSNTIHVGDTGVAVNVLRPSGKALINELKFEVFSVDGYIESGTHIKVTKIDGNKIWVRATDQH